MNQNLANRAAAALAKLDRGVPLDGLEERLDLNTHLADEMAGKIDECLKGVRSQNNSPVMFTRGNHNANKLAVRLILRAVYGVLAQHTHKRQMLEAEILDLRQRIADLEGAPPIKGTFDRLAKYRARDIVAIGGASFMARRDDPGPCPGDGWQLTAAQGKRGKPGPRVKALNVNDQGMLTLMNSDGTTVKCDLYPLLAKVQQA